MQRSMLVAIALFGLISGTSALAKECGSNALPLAARGLLAQRLPNWRIVTISDLSSDDQKLWLENYDGKCPGIVEGSFTGAHSFAVSLLHQEDAGLSQTLLLLEPSQGAYAVRTLSKASQTAVPNVVLKFPPGTYKDAERTHSVQTKFDGVAYIKLEAAGTLYYRSREGFKSLEISE